MSLGRVEEGSLWGGRDHSLVTRRAGSLGTMGGLARGSHWVSHQRVTYVDEQLGAISCY